METQRSALHKRGNFLNFQKGLLTCCRVDFAFFFSFSFFFLLKNIFCLNTTRVKYDTALRFVRRREKYQKKYKFLIVLNSLLNKPNKSA